MSSLEEEQRYLEQLRAECDSEREDRNTSDEEDDVIDTIEVSDHRTESEQSADEEGPSTIEIQPVSPTRKCISLGKDNVTQWELHCAVENQSKRTPQNIIRESAGPTNATKQVKGIEEIWLSFFSNEMLDLIVYYTNIYIQHISTNYNRERDAKETNKPEIKALLGLLYLSGITKTLHRNIFDAWSSDGTGIEYFRLIMSFSRFKFLLHAIRFDDITTRENRKINDKLAPIREIFEMFVEKCRNNFKMGVQVTLDEMLESFCGRCPFMQYIPNKPAKYGIKIFALVDSVCHYAGNLEIYTGKQSAEFETDNRPHQIVLRMIQPISQTGRNVTMDNWFSSVQVAEELVKHHKLSMVGTISKNKRELPKIVTKIKVGDSKRPVGSSMFAYRENTTLTSYVSKPNKLVLLISTMHIGDGIDKDSGKPVILMDYNRFKGAVDTLDEMKSLYSVGRKSCRWPLTVFYTLLNIGGINSQVIYRSNNINTKPISRSQFLKNLAKSLTYEQMKIRVEIKTLPRQLTLRIRNILGIDNKKQDTQGKIEGRCYLCGWKKGNRTRTKCHRCEGFICKKHATHICEECKDNEEGE